ncbi:MAG: HPr family phosphocarrier protein [Clostridia bacterium]|nr:HPr family phosphocarrier protein [Clostridia bacterium]
MEKTKYIIKDENGIHARPAGLLVKLAGGFTSDIKLIKGEKSADLKRLFAVMGLGIKKGDEILVTANGDDEKMAVETIELFLKTNL